MQQYFFNIFFFSLVIIIIDKLWRTVIILKISKIIPIHTFDINMPHITYKS